MATTTIFVYISEASLAIDRLFLAPVKLRFLTNGNELWLVNRSKLSFAKWRM
jgi:hypothetical protein